MTLDTAAYLPDGPAHLRARPDRLFLLRRWANGVAGLYGEPVYLCGSALVDDNGSPRDWDVRVRLDSEAFTARYGEPDLWECEGVTGDWTSVRWRWAADAAKQTRRAWRHTRLNIDFQTMPAAYWDRVYGNRPRVRLDTAPTVLPSNPAAGSAVSLALGLIHVCRTTPNAPVAGGPGVIYVGDETAHPSRMGDQAVATLAELGWVWTDVPGCWVTPG